MTEDKSIKGGTLVIPDGWFVYSANFDCEVPYITICCDGKCNEIKLEIPEALAYYLTTHFCGSEKMKNHYETSARNGLRRELKELMEME